MPESSSPPPARSRSDAVLAALVVGFAFLAASFTARNSDVWRHLAAGRLILNGDYSFGTDPFSFATLDQYWANHSWLADAGMFLAFTKVGGAALVALKAVGVAVLAALMLAAARGRGPFWVAAGCVTLGVLAASPRLVLDTACISMVLLALCLVLIRSERGARFLPLVVAAWVNLDGWFVLGPLLVGLVWVGRRIGRTPPLPPWTFALCVAACVLSPHHVRAFTLPAELSPTVWGGAFRTDPRFAAFFAHPWHAPADDLAGWAFFALVGLGILSMIVNRRVPAEWRLVWCAFLALAAWNARLVPFFAVAAAPVTALALRDRLAPDFLNRAGRALAFTLGVALVLLAWQGMLQGLRPGDRGTAWAVHPDPTLERVATGLVGEKRFAATHPDVSNYAAWFAPGVKTFVDSRFNLFAHVATDFVNVSRHVGVLPRVGEMDASSGGTYLFNEKVERVVLYDPDPRRVAAAVRNIAATAKVWNLQRVDGAAVVLSWRALGPLTPPTFLSGWAAFGPAADRFPRPAEDAPRFGKPFSLADFAPARGRKGSWEADAAGTFLRMYEASPASANPNAQDAPNATALPYLAVRAARRGITLDPDDPVAWAALGRAYSYLAATKAEATDAAAFTLLRELRQVQMVTALVQAANLDPDSAATHELLATVFAQKGLFDLAFKHASATVALATRAGPVAGESAELFQERVGQLTRFAAGVEKAMQDGENRFVVNTQALAGNPLARARTALQLGLGAKAIDALMKSHLDLYGLEGLRMLLELLLHTGQAEEARVLLDRDELRRDPSALGFVDLAGPPGARWAYRLQAFGWFDLCQCAAAGRYNSAEAALDRLRADFRPEEDRVAPRVAKLFAHQLASEVGLAAPPASLFARLLGSRERDQLAAQFGRVRFLSAQRADLHTLGGVFLLEKGEPAAARREFEAAAAIYAREQDVSPATPGRPLAARYLQAIDAGGR